MPILEHIVGSTSANVYEAIFETDMSTGFNLFEDTDDEANGGDIINGGRGRDRDRECDVFGPRSRRASRESLRAPSITVVGPSGSEPRASSRPQSVSRTPQTPTSHTRVRRDVTASGGGISPNASPRPRRVALPQVQLANLGEIPAVTPRSPLTSLFMGRVREHTSSQVDKAAAVTATAEAGIRRIEALAEDIKRLPVNKLKDEMKELQVGFRTFVFPFYSYFLVVDADRSGCCRTVKRGLRICF